MKSELRGTQTNIHLMVIYLFTARWGKKKIKKKSHSVALTNNINIKKFKNQLSHYMN